MTIHWTGCTLGAHSLDTACHDNGMNILGNPNPCEEGCTIGQHDSGIACFPAVIPDRPRNTTLQTSRLDVVIPAGPQPTKPGPYHAVVRGPDGLDVSVSGDGPMFGRILGSVGDTLSAFLEG
jgi:hypothetical protein